MIRIALYARFSSDNQREQSITDQYRVCEEYIARHPEWTIVHRYKDGAISGTQDAAGRAGYRAKCWPTRRRNGSTCSWCTTSRA
jgi:hypothetical protein